MRELEDAGSALGQLEQALDGCRRRLAWLRARRRGAPGEDRERALAAEVAVEEAREEALVVALAEVRWTGRLSPRTVAALPRADRSRLLRQATGGAGRPVDPAGGRPR